MLEPDRPCIPRSTARSYAARVNPDPLTPDPHRPPRWRHWLRWLWLCVGIVAIVLLFRRPLADRLWPEARAQLLREQAAAALAHGHLTAVDGSGARELYEAALAIDPDRDDARVGLMHVTQAALNQARGAMIADRYTDAHKALQLARALSVPRAQADLLDAQLRQREAAHAGIAHLLKQAAAARSAHRLEGSDDAALPLYRRILSLQPNRTEALEGREDALADVLQSAQQALQRDDLVEAARLIAIAREYDPGHGDLPETQARMANAIDMMHQHAGHALRQGQLEMAADSYRKLLQIDGEDAIAQRGLEQVAIAWAHRAEQLASNFRFTQAKTALAQARGLSPQATAVHAAERAIVRAQQAKSHIGPTIPNAQRARHVRALLKEADAAEARGDLLTPPGDSAFDKLRAARAMAPDDPAVRRASERLLPAARVCFERELRNNDLGRAHACLDARVVLDGESTATAHARRRLAQRWLAVGEERLNAGEVSNAAIALERARALDPATPGLNEFAERIRTAGAR